MKLILTAEVDHLGSAGDTVEVKDGYGRNYLLPRGLAIVRHRGAERQADASVGPARPRPFATWSTPMNSRPPSRAWTRCPSGAGPRRTPASCSVRSRRPTSSAAIKKAGGPNLDKRTVQLPKAHIKSARHSSVAVRLHPDVDAAVSRERGRGSR